MASVRMPVDGENFLQFVVGTSGERKDLSYIPTFAHLICTAAAYGLSHGEYVDDPECKLKQPDPVALDIFKNRNLDEVLLVLAINHTEDTAIANDPDALCRVIEGLAAGGFLRMVELLQEGGSAHSWLDDWEDAVLSAASEDLADDAG